MRARPLLAALLLTASLSACDDGEVAAEAPPPVPAAPAPSAAETLLGLALLSPDDALVAAAGLLPEDLPPDSASALSADELPPT